MKKKLRSEIILQKKKKLMVKTAIIPYVESKNIVVANDPGMMCVDD